MIIWAALYGTSLLLGIILFRKYAEKSKSRMDVLKKDNSGSIHRLLKVHDTLLKKIEVLENELDFTDKGLKRLVDKYCSALSDEDHASMDRVELLGLTEAALTADIAIIKSLSTELDAIELALGHEVGANDSPLTLVMDIQNRLILAEKALSEAKSLKEAGVRVSEMAALYEAIGAYYGAYNKPVTQVEAEMVALPKESATDCTCAIDSRLCLIHHKPLGRA